MHVLYLSYKIHCLKTFRVTSRLEQKTGCGLHRGRGNEAAKIVDDGNPPLSGVSLALRPNKVLKLCYWSIRQCQLTLYASIRFNFSMHHTHRNSSRVSSGVAFAFSRICSRVGSHETARWQFCRQTQSPFSLLAICGVARNEVCSQRWDNTWLEAVFAQHSRVT